MIWAPQIEFSDDPGQEWALPEVQPRFSDADDLTVKRLWHVETGLASEPTTLCESRARVAVQKRECKDYLDRVICTSAPAIQPGSPGLGAFPVQYHSPSIESVHHVRGISAVGMFGTVDGGKTWLTMNQEVRPDFLPDHLAAFDQ